MKDYKYYPPEMEPNWKDWVFENWDLLNLIGVIIIAALLIAICEWLGRM